MSVPYHGAYALPEPEDYDKIREGMFNRILSERLDKLPLAEQERFVDQCLKSSGLSYDEFKRDYMRRRYADELQKATTDSWHKIRARIWERDQGQCHCCGAHIDKRDYDCGHIIDRCVGGPDRESNLVVMCVYCNMGLKPVHRTREEYLLWLDRSSALLNYIGRSWEHVRG